MSDRKRIPRDAPAGEIIESGLTPNKIVESASRSRSAWLMRKEALEYHSLPELTNILILFSISEVRKLIEELPVDSKDQVIVWLRSHLEQHIEGFDQVEAEFHA